MAGPSIGLEVSRPKNISPTKNGEEKGLAYMTSMLKAIQKGQIKAAKSKKRKKGSYYSNSDSDSEQEFWSGDTGLSRDKRLKLDKPNGVNLISTTNPPIKVTKLAQNVPEGSRDNEIDKICKNTGKVTAAVAVMTVSCKKIKSSTMLNHKKPACALNSKKLALNQTNFEQKHAKSCPNRPRKHDKSASKKLIVKNRQLGSYSTLDQVETSFL